MTVTAMPKNRPGRSRMVAGSFSRPFSVTFLTTRRMRHGRKQISTPRWRTSLEEALVALTLDDGSSIFKRVGAALPGGLAHLRQFESIGGLGSSQVLAIGKAQAGIMGVRSA